MWWWPAQTALCSGVMPSSLGLLGSSTWDKGVREPPRCTGGLQGRAGCGPRGAAYLIDDPLHQVKLPLQGGVQEQRQGVEADPQATARALRVGLLQVGPLALPGGGGCHLR